MKKTIRQSFIFSFLVILIFYIAPMIFFGSIVLINNAKEYNQTGELKRSGQSFFLDGDIIDLLIFTGFSFILFAILFFVLKNLWIGLLCLIRKRLK